MEVQPYNEFEDVVDEVLSTDQSNFSLNKWTQAGSL